MLVSHQDKMLRSGRESTQQHFKGICHLLSTESHFKRGFRLPLVPESGHSVSVQHHLLVNLTQNNWR